MKKDKKKWFICYNGEDQKLGRLKETSCLGWSSFHTVMIFRSFVIGIPRKYRKIISVALHSYYIHLSLLTIFISVSISGKFANSLFPQQSFIKLQETLRRVLEVDVLSPIWEQQWKKISGSCKGCWRGTKQDTGHLADCHVALLSLVLLFQHDHLRALTLGNLQFKDHFCKARNCPFLTMIERDISFLGFF